jgi:branched-chain amino acid transport system substrate-binding protein
MKKQVLLMAALSAAGCASAQETVRIGHVAAMTGPVAHFGKDSENGVRMAVESLNHRRKESEMGAGRRG